MNRFLLALFLTTASAVSAADLKVGLIGLDTSHVIAFTRILNDPSNKQHVPGAKVVAGYRGGSPDLDSSRNRIDKFTAQLEEMGIEIVPDIPTLLSKVDVVLLESVDGRKHLEQAIPVFESGKPVFIDKPLAATLEDAREIARLGKKHNAPWWSSSSLRYSDIVQASREMEGIKSVLTWGPGPLEATHHLDLSWYAIHPIEMLYAVMGPGCVSVSRVYTDDADVITGIWKDGRTGTVKTIRSGKSDYGAILFGEKEIKISSDPSVSYANLMSQIVEFFRTRKPPVPNEETVEIFAFMDAALRSKEQGGQAVTLR